MYFRFEIQKVSNIISLSLHFNIFPTLYGHSTTGATKQGESTNKTLCKIKISESTRYCGKDRDKLITTTTTGDI